MCSNDLDVEPAFKFVRQDAPDVQIGLVMPLWSEARGQGVVLNKRLAAQATWVGHHILDAALAASQFPPHVPTKKKPVKKPTCVEHYSGQRMLVTYSTDSLSVVRSADRTLPSQLCLSDRPGLSNQVALWFSSFNKCLSAFDFPFPRKIKLTKSRIICIFDYVIPASLTSLAICLAVICRRRY